MDASIDQHTATAPQGASLVLTGGGSGGHITPVLAVAHELKQRRPDLKLIYIGQKGEKLQSVVAGSADIDAIAYVWAGKWRRYHGESWRQFLDLPMVFKNIRDFTRVLRGTWQSYRLLGKYKPAGVFIRGGFVGVPVGLAAHWRKVPFITHDSDALPSLANRIIGRWAAVHAVGMPVEMYSYPPAKTRYVGVPIAAEFHPVNDQEKQQAKQALGLINNDQVLLLTGGGNGAQLLNEALVRLAPSLLQRYPTLAILHATGPDHEAIITTAYDAVIPPEQRHRVKVTGFLQPMYRYSSVADVIISRAGATNLAEWAAQHKACIIIPNPALTGGHQLKNTEALAKQGAIVVVTETDLKTKTALETAVQELLDNPAKREALSRQISSFAKPQAAGELATLLLETFRLTGREGS